MSPRNQIKYAPLNWLGVALDHERNGRIESADRALDLACRAEEIALDYTNKDPVEPVPNMYQ